MLAAFPFRWLSVALIFLVVAESAMFIPRVGFTIKLAVAAVLSAQVIALFSGAAQGAAPSALDLWRGFLLPPDALALLVAVTLLPFAAGLIYLRVASGPASLRFFFGNIRKDKPPQQREFARFKYVMQVAALPFVWVAGAIVLLGQSGGAAMTSAFGAISTAWPSVVAIGLMGLAFEWLAVALPRRLPKGAAVALISVMLVGFLLWSFAFLYALSVRALAVS